MKKLGCIIAVILCGLSFGMTACQKTDDVTVYAPDGAPALAIAKLLKEDTEDDGVSYRVVNPQSVKTYVMYKDQNKNADICILPFTTATEQLGKKGSYQVLGVVTHGNLYLISKEQTPIENVSQLSGKTVGVLQLQSAPGQVFKSILQKSGVTNVTLTGITSGADVGALEGVQYYLLAEPAVTAQKNKGYSIVGNIQTLYGGEFGFPQAVVVAKTDLIEKNTTCLKTVIDGIKSSSAWLQTATGAEIVSAVATHTAEGYETTLKSPLLTADVLGRCGVYFTQTKDCKTEMQRFLQDVMMVDANIQVTPDDGFYSTIDFNA